MHMLNGLLPLKLRDHSVSGNWDPMLVIGPGGALRVGGAGERLGSLIRRRSGETEGAGSDRLQEGRAGREQPDRISQTEEKLIEPPLIEKSTDPQHPCCEGAAVVAHVKRLATNWGGMG